MRLHFLRSILLVFLLGIVSAAARRARKRTSRADDNVCRAASLFPDYERLHMRMLKLADDETRRTEARFVVFRICCGELGNRLLGLVSSFLLALLTDRALLIDWPEVPGFSGDAFDDLFETSHSLPSNFQSLLRRWDLPIHKAQSMMKELELNNARPEPYEHLLCSNLSKVYQDVPFLIATSNQYFVPALHFNIFYRERIRNLFGPCESGGREGREGRAIFAPLLAYIARPRLRILRRIERFREEHFKGKQVVGMQIRRQMRKGKDKEGAATTEEHVAMHFKCAREALSRAQGEVVYFLATDHEATRLTARKQLGDSLVHLNGTIDSSRGGMEDAVVDMWLLGECDQLVVTGGSTFGFVSHGRTKKKPWLIPLEKPIPSSSSSSSSSSPNNNNNTSSSWEKPRCEREVTCEPCFHMWPMMMAQSCYKGKLEDAMKEFGQLNCRPWDMELFSFK